jgi:excinuclease UvrABC nuclease subunit
MNSQQLKKYKIPDKPGVYFFMKNKDILYVGKATSLKDRVKSYFSRDLFNMRGPLIVDMITKATSIKWQETDSVLEALILEANLIKKHQPYYNTKEKDDKSFNYVCITKDNKVALVRGKLLQLNHFKKVFGPYPNGNQLREALKIVRRIFPYIEERKGSKGKEEFYKQIKLFPKDSIENRHNIKNIKLFFEGKKRNILKNLENEMKKFAKAHEFERAGEIKRQIFALQHIQDVSLIKNDLLETRTSHLEPNRIEAYDIAHTSGKNMVGVMVVVENGEVNKNEYRKFKIKNYHSSNDTGALLEILERRFNHGEWVYPRLIVIDGGRAQLNTVKRFEEKAGLDIPIAAVVKDEKHRPKGILYSGEVKNLDEKAILLANSEAHRFAISYHRNIRGKNMLK